MDLFKIALKDMDEYLGGKMDPTDVTLLSKLQDRGILSEEDIEKIENNEKYVTAKQKVKFMLKQLRKRDDGYFEPFCKILEEYSREAAEKLRDNVSAAQPCITNNTPEAEKAVAVVPPTCSNAAHQLRVETPNDDSEYMDLR